MEISLLKGNESVDTIEVSDFNTRKPEKQTLKSILNTNHPRFRFAVRITVCMLLGYLLVVAFNIEKGGWILMTSLVVCQQTYTATRQRFFHRVLGTLSGVILGVSCAQLLPTVIGQILLLLCSIYLFFYWLKIKYSIASTFITIFVIAIFNLLSNEGIALMGPRIIDTLLGCGISFAAVRFIWPDWQYKNIPQLILIAIQKNKRYFESIYISDVEEKDYLHNRRTAYTADNDLTSSWKGMRFDPKSKKIYQKKAFNITYINHLLLSYISALGVHRSDGLSKEEVRLCGDVGFLLGYVLESLKTDLSEEDFAKYSAKAIAFERDFSDRDNIKDNRTIILIHNISRVVRDLLDETKDIRKLYNKTEKNYSKQ